MPLQPIIPTWLALNACDFTSPTGLVDKRTGEPIAAGGLNIGDYFDMTEEEANKASYAPNGILHAGRYRFVHLDPNANPANVVIGRVGYMPNTAAPDLNMVTSYTGGVIAWVHPRIFLNPITPGNYGFVQELGIANVRIGPVAAGGGVVGALLAAATTGLILAGTSTFTNNIGIALDVPVVNTVIRAFLNQMPVPG